MSDISTYKNILISISELERLNDLQEKRVLKYVILMFVTSLLILVCYCAYSNDISYLTSPDIIGMALVPAFSFLYSSYINDRQNSLKSEIYNSLLRLYEDGKIQDFPFEIKEVKATINSILNSRVNAK